MVSSMQPVVIRTQLKMIIFEGLQAKFYENEEKFAQFSSSLPAFAAVHIAILMRHMCLHNLTYSRPHLFTFIRLTFR